MRYDVIVVGGGPAGSTAARECAERGLSVLLLDKAEFPRDKPCGGGVNLRAARLLPFDLNPVIERTITGMRVSVRQGRSFTRLAEGRLTYLTQRSRLDAFLLEKARASGAGIRERVNVREVERHPDHLVVRSGNEAFEARSLVAADGSNGQIAKMTKLPVKRWLGIALEGNVSPANGFPRDWESIFGIDVGSVPGGYGWLFPKGDHVNIGVGGWYSIGTNVRPLLDRMTRFYGFEPESLCGIRGHPLAVPRPGTLLALGNVLAVGDAAGLIDPLTGEGIYSAIWSGQVAARALEAYLGGFEPDLSAYDEELQRELLSELLVSHQLRDLFHLSPVICAAIVQRSSRAWSVVCRLLTGEQTYTGVKKRSRLLGAGIDLGSQAARTAPQIRRRLRERVKLPRASRSLVVLRSHRKEDNVKREPVSS